MNARSRIDFVEDRVACIQRQGNVFCGHVQTGKADAKIADDAATGFDDLMMNFVAHQMILSGSIFVDGKLDHYLLLCGGDGRGRQALRGKRVSAFKVDHQRTQRRNRLARTPPFIFCRNELTDTRTAIAYHNRGIPAHRIDKFPVQIEQAIRRADQLFFNQQFGVKGRSMARRFHQAVAVANPRRDAVAATGSVGGLDDNRRAIFPQKRDGAF